MQRSFLNKEVAEIENDLWIFYYFVHLTLFSSIWDEDWYTFQKSVFIYLNYQVILVGYITFAVVQKSGKEQFYSMKLQALHLWGLLHVNFLSQSCWSKSPLLNSKKEVLWESHSLDWKQGYVI